MSIRQAQTALGQKLNELGHVFVSALARENFISDNDESKIGLWGLGHD
jgi:hypothetical protein